MDRYLLPDGRWEQCPIIPEQAELPEDKWEMAYLFKVSAKGEKVLVEMAGKEAKAALAGEHPEARLGVRYEPCPLARAHQWVMDGGDHQTSLWLDFAGRLRRAK